MISRATWNLSSEFLVSVYLQDREAGVPSKKNKKREKYTHIDQEIIASTSLSHDNKHSLLHMTNKQHLKKIF